jgi:hypothetical protein
MPGHTAKEIVAARHLLSKKDRALARADKVTPPFDWHTRDMGFSGPTAGAGTTGVDRLGSRDLARVTDRFSTSTPSAVLAKDQAYLRLLGLFRQSTMHPCNRGGPAVRTLGFRSASRARRRKRCSQPDPDYGGRSLDGRCLSHGLRRSNRYLSRGRSGPSRRSSPRRQSPEPPWRRRAVQTCRELETVPGCRGSSAVGVLFSGQKGF